MTVFGHCQTTQNILPVTLYHWVRSPGQPARINMSKTGIRPLCESTVMDLILFLSIIPDAIYFVYDILLLLPLLLTSFCKYIFIYGDPLWWRQDGVHNNNITYTSLYLFFYYSVLLNLISIHCFASWFYCRHKEMNIIYLF